jgi:hypothetical protein
MTDALDRAKALATEARDCQVELAELEQKSSDVKKRLNAIVTDELVVLMQEADLDSIGIPAQGNLPAMDMDLVTFVSASIPKSWDQQRREAAFDLLPGDLVKVELTVPFSRFDYAEAQKLAKQLVGHGHTVLIEKTCHHKTLEAWLKDKMSKGEPLPDLQTIGATIGPRVKMNERRD